MPGPPSISRLIGPIGLPAGIIATVCGLACVGLGANVPVEAGVFSAISMLLHAGLFAAAYLLAAFGLGRLPAAWLARDSESRLWLQAALGLALMLWLSHLLGMLGLLGFSPVAWLVVAAGLLLLGHQIVCGPLHPEKWPLLPASSLLWAPALGVLLIAAVNPPGWLWESEHGAYDVLEYHLQLPKEWLCDGRLWPSEHNVYSFLPSYMESAYLHVACLMPGSGRGREVESILGGDGLWVMSCQLLHAMLVPLAGLLVARAVWTLLRGMGAAAQAVPAAAMAGAAVVSLPWMTVAGSLAYNDVAVVALGAGAVLASIDARLTPARKAAAAGLLVGAACSAKPTALFLLAPLIAVALAGWNRPREWPRAIGAGLVASVAAVAPWLIRNSAASGNPVFPFAAGIFGRAHWTAEQVARYQRVHVIDAGLMQRVGLFFSSDRGLRHEQWSIALPLCAMGLLAALAWKPTRRIGWLLGAGALAQVAGWMFFTHLQSRFLLPLVIPIGLLLGLGVALLLAWAARNRTPSIRLLALAVASLAPLSLAAWNLLNFLSQRSGEPNALLVTGVGVWTGEALIDSVAEQPAPAQREFLLNDRCGPQAFINLAVNPGLLRDPLGLNFAENSGGQHPHKTYLLGDAGALYYLGAFPGFFGGVVYHTTWDASPLGAAMQQHPNDPAAWTAALREQHIGLVLINFNELHRLIDIDHYYDPAVTSEQVRAWLTDPAAACKPIRSWPLGAAPGTGMVLFKLDQPAR